MSIPVKSEARFCGMFDTSIRRPACGGCPSSHPCWCGAPLCVVLHSIRPALLERAAGARANAANYNGTWHQADHSQPRAETTGCASRHWRSASGLRRKRCTNNSVLW